MRISHKARLAHSLRTEDLHVVRQSFDLIANARIERLNNPGHRSQYCIFAMATSGAMM